MERVTTELHRKKTVTYMGHGASISDETDGDRSPDRASPDNSSSSIIMSDVATGFTDKCQFELGDYLVCNLSDGSSVEGLYVERSNQDDNDCITLFSDGEYTICLASNCTVLSKADELEVGDHVQAKPVGEMVHYLGRISCIHQQDGALLYDVEMDGDPDDKECGIPASSIIKIMSRRAVAMHRWRKGLHAIHAIHSIMSKTKFDSSSSMGSRLTDHSVDPQDGDDAAAGIEPGPAQ